MRDFRVVLILVSVSIMIMGGCGGGGPEVGMGPDKFAPVSVTVSPAGGNYELENGMKLTIPAGAVAEPTTLTFHRFNESEVVQALQASGSSEKKFLAAFRAKPAGTKFNVPIEISLPLEEPFISSAPIYLYRLNLDTGISTSVASNDLKSTPADLATRLIDQPLAGMLWFVDCETSTFHIVDINIFPEGKERDLVAAAINIALNETDCDTEPCRCCGTKRNESAADRITEGGPVSCFNAEYELETKFTNCPDQPIEFYKVSETSVHNFNVLPENRDIKTGNIGSFFVHVLNADGQEMPFYSIQKRPTSSDSNIADVLSFDPLINQFQVKGVAPGQADITVTVNCQIQKTITINVPRIDIVTDKTSVSVPEGQTAIFNMKLAEKPPSGETVRLSVNKSRGDPDITVLSEQLRFSFDENNWNTFQTVTLAANEDIDIENGEATFKISDGPVLANDKVITAVEVDNDILQFITDSAEVTVPEGGTGTFQVKLSNQPTDSIAVTVAHVFGDTDVTVQSGGSLLFDPSNWNVFQRVTLRAAEDPDVVNGVATIRIFDMGGNITEEHIPANEVDADQPSLTITPGNICVETGRTANLSVVANEYVDMSTIRWSSVDFNTVTVDEMGIITAIDTGIAIITAEGSGIGDPAKVGGDSATVEVNEKCVSIIAPEDCLVADISSQFEASIYTPLQGYYVAWRSLDERIAMVNQAGLVTGTSTGTVDIEVKVDNVVTQYIATIGIQVTSFPDDYKLAWLDVPAGPQPYLTNSRRVVTQGELDAIADAEAVRCGIAVPDSATVMGFNKAGQLIGHYQKADGNIGGYVFDTNICAVDYINYPGALSTEPNSINDDGQIVGWYGTRNADGDNFQFGFLYDGGSFTSFTPPGSEAILYDINNPGFSSSTRSEMVVGYGWNKGEPKSHGMSFVTSIGSFIGDLVPLGDANGINDQGYVLGNFRVDGTFEPFVYDYNNADTFTALPGYPGGNFEQINNYDDILGTSLQVDYYLMHLCPFSLDDDPCDWLYPVSYHYIDSYEEEELTCDGLDNDCDGFDDENLLPGPNSKQVGVCAGSEQECQGNLGWVDEYSGIPAYETMEITCDGLDNDCDGIVDEGCGP